MKDRSEIYCQNEYREPSHERKEKDGKVKKKLAQGLQLKNKTEVEK